MNPNIRSTIAVRCCFTEITPESAVDGDHSDSGVVWTDDLSFKDLVYRMKNDFTETSDYPAGPHSWLSTGYFTSDYETATEREETLHPADHSPRTMRYWAKAMKAAGYIK